MHGLSNFVQLIPAGFLKLRVLCVQDKHTRTCANFHAAETWISDNYVLLYRTKIGLSRHCGVGMPCLFAEGGGKAARFASTFDRPANLLQITNTRDGFFNSNHAMGLLWHYWKRLRYSLTNWSHIVAKVRIVKSALPPSSCWSQCQVQRALRLARDRSRGWVS